MGRLVMPALIGIAFAVPFAFPGEARSQERTGETRSSQVPEGWRQYMVHCARCHGDDAVGGVMAPDLRRAVARGAVDEQGFLATVREGRRENGMPPFGKVLSEDQMAAIHRYVAARATGEVPAGRPSE